jgi:hypothetical protein
MFTKFLQQAQEIVAQHRAEYYGHYIMFGGGSTSSTTKTDPWSGQQPYLNQAFQSARDLYNNGNTATAPQYYGSSTVAGFNPTERNAISGISDTGMNGNSALNSAGDALTNYNNGSMLSASNPYFQQMAQNISSTVTPQIESQFTHGNAMNNPAAAFATSQGLGSAIGNLAYQNYNDQSKNQLTAASLSPQQYQTQLGGQQAALTAGQAQQTQDQSQLTDQVNRWNYNQQLPYQQLNQFTNTINGQYGSTGSTTSPNQSLLGSLFSDRRVKEDIKRIGSADNGLPIYLYRYKGDDVYHIGFMADEVEKVSPEAVSEYNGIKMVNYKKAIGE